MRVLVVDDSPDVRLLCQVTLERAGWSVTGATDGLEAAKAVDEDTPDVVVLDLMMPDYDGLFFLGRLRERSAERPELPAPPVLVLSAKSGSDDQATAFEAGASAYLTKPFAIDDLTRAVAELAGVGPG